MDNNGFYGNVSFATDYVHRYRPYNRSTGMNGLGSARAIRSGRYLGAIGRQYQGGTSSRGSDVAMMRTLGMTPAGPNFGGLGDGLGSASDREMCRVFASIGADVINAILSGARPTDERERREYDRVAGMFSGDQGMLRSAVNFCNLIEQADSQSTPTGGPSAWEIEQARRRFEQQQRAQGKKTWQTVAMVGGIGAAALAVWYLVK